MLRFSLLLFVVGLFVAIPFAISFHIDPWAWCIGTNIERVQIVELHGAMVAGLVAIFWPLIRKEEPEFPRKFPPNDPRTPAYARVRR